MKRTATKPTVKPKTPAGGKRLPRQWAKPATPNRSLTAGEKLAISKGYTP